MSSTVNGLLHSQRHSSTTKCFSAYYAMMDHFDCLCMSRPFPNCCGNQGIVLTALGTYNAGQGMVDQAEDNFAEAFAILAPVRQDSMRSLPVIRENN